MYEFHILELRKDGLRRNSGVHLRKEFPDLCDTRAALKQIELASQLVN